MVQIMVRDKNTVKIFINQHINHKNINDQSICMIVRTFNIKKYKKMNDSQ